MKRLIFLLLLACSVFAQQPKIVDIDGVTHFAFTREEAEKIAVAMKENQMSAKIDSLYAVKARADSLTIVSLEQAIEAKDEQIKKHKEIAEILESMEPKWYEKPPMVAIETITAMLLISITFSNFSQ